LRTETVVYKQAGTQSLVLEIVSPQVVPRGGLPCVVMFHGGAWRKGAPEQMMPMGEAFARQGVIGISAQYRLLEEGPIRLPMEAVEDARSAMRYVRKNAGKLGCDAGRIAAAGGSSGGHLAAMTAMKVDIDAPADDRSVSPRPDALILLNAPLDLMTLRSRVPKVARQISPLHLVDASLPPTIIFHGTGDNMVPFSQATSFQQQASRQGAKRVEVVQFDGRGHGFWNANRKRGVDFREVIGDSLSFLRSLDWPTSGVPQPLAERQDREKAVTP